jgi:lipoprotein-anchoring transpeptidase ErfK/SrfK
VRAVPKHSGTGRRIVYSERTPQHAWLIDGHGKVVRDFAVSGRKDWPRTGTYRVFSKSPRSWSTTYGVSFRWMVRFAQGHNASIGFHTIPRYPSGKKMQRLNQLGQPVGRGGCPHSADADAKFLYRWATIGTKVVVVR